MTRKLLVALGRHDRRAVRRSERAGAHGRPLWQCRASPTYASVNGPEPRRADRRQRQHQHRQRRQPRPRAVRQRRDRRGQHRDADRHPAGRHRRRARPGQDGDRARARQGDRPEADRDREGREPQVQIPAGSPSLLGVKAATSSATGTCVSGSTTPKLDGDEPGRRPHASLGAPIGLDGLLGALDAARCSRSASLVDDQDQREDPDRRRR